jgi:hypothetical protein
MSKSVGWSLSKLNRMPATRLRSPNLTIISCFNHQMFYPSAVLPSAVLPSPVLIISRQTKNINKESL